MKKLKGFTLAEVLITLAIIGVVAAIATPALVGTYQKSKVGPSLRKFLNTMEVAHEHLMSNDDSDDLFRYTAQQDLYFERLSGFVSGKTDSDYNLGNLTLPITTFLGTDATSILGDSTATAKIYNLKGGDSFSVVMDNAEALAENRTKAEGSYKGKAGLIFYDMNSFDEKPNRLGKDIFCFVLDGGGALIPYGGKAHHDAYNDETVPEKAWDTGSDKCKKTAVGAGQTCAGAIADNGWKVEYKY